MIGKLDLLLSINGEISLGWKLRAGDSIIGSYLAAIFGAVLLLILGRRWQNYLLW
jgi:hypothetical protein